MNLRVLVLLLAFILSISCRESKDAQVLKAKPNIILIVSDDQGWGDLSVNGNKTLSTPNIDALAQNGVLFENFYVSPVCSPTRAEILTGRFSPRTGVYSTSQGGERIDLDEYTLAQMLSENGYATAAFGKWHNGMQYPYHPNARGFDEFYGFCSGHWGNYFSPMLEHNSEIVKGNGFVIDDFTDKAIEFMEQKKEEPFFVYLPFNTPHSPMQVPDRWYDKFQNIEISQSGTNSDSEDIEHTKAALAMCENIDWNVGRILTKLKELNKEEDTVIIYMSDNGPNGHRWNGDLKGIKGSTDEGGVKSPFMIQWKANLEPNRRIKEIASAIDILPSIKEITSSTISANKPLDGKSLWPLLSNQNHEWEDRMVFSYWKNSISVRSQIFRLDHNDRLYHMIDDPGQLRDVSDTYAEEKARLLLAKTKYKEEVVSELPEVDNRPIPVGHPNYKYTQLPARDGIAHGQIKRSNRWPNCSYFTNWSEVDDKITWEVSILEGGDFDITIYYTCPEENLGSIISFQFADAIISREIKEAHDPKPFGMENDRGKERAESYVKEFKPINLGRIFMDKSRGQITLSADNIVGGQSIDFRMLMLERV